MPSSPLGGLVSRVGSGDETTFRRPGDKAWSL